MATAACLAGAIIFLFYNEKEIMAEIGRLRFTVQALEGHRITRVRIERTDGKKDEAGVAASDAS